jgi:hypothetical protein
MDKIQKMTKGNVGMNAIRKLNIMKRAILIIDISALLSLKNCMHIISRNDVL